MTQTKTEQGHGAQPPGRHQPRGGAASAGVFGRLGGSVLRLKEASVIVVIIALFIYFAAREPVAFNSVNNYLVISHYIAPVAIIAAGEVMLLISGEIDLSAGNTFAFVPIVLYLLNQAGLPLALAVVLSLVAAALVGLVNGIVTVKFGVASFITTLGMLFLLRGLSLVLAGGRPVAAPSGGVIPDLLGGWGWSEIIWAVGIIIVMQVVLVGTPFGQHTIAVGQNLTGASEAGVKTHTIKITSFVLTSVLAGFAGILDGFRVTSFYPLAGGPLEMFMAVAGAVIGGTALRGGVGTVVGALFGAAFLGILKDGLHIIGISAYPYFIILGAAVLVAMLLNIALMRLRERSAT